MDIYYEETGTGYPVLLLHGNQENHTIFDDLVRDLKHDWRLVAIDSRWHGRSARSGELSLAQMAKDTKAVADELGLTEYDIIGFSDGANIALTLAQDDPRIKHMILIGPNTNPKAIKTAYRIPYRLEMVLLLPFCLYAKNARRRFRLYRFMFQEPHFSDEELASIKVPTLILSGHHDIIKTSDMDHIASCMPYCVHVILEGTHFLLRDAYQKTLKEIRRFLNESHK